LGVSIGKKHVIDLFTPQAQGDAIMIGMVVMFVGVAIAVIGGIWLLVVAFQESVGWGIACLLIPFVSLVFVIMHWDKAKKPFLVNLLGAAIIIVGGAALGGSK
jgi:hypothetical protein